MSVPRRVYLAVFAALLALTALTVAAAERDLGPLNTPIALGIASLKAALVGLYFMHLRWGGRLVRIAVAGGLVWLCMLVFMTLSDFLTRNWV